MVKIWGLWLATAAAATQATGDPYTAYAQGRFRDAFEGFASLQAKQPKNVPLMLNMGATLYRLADYAGAQRALSLAAAQGNTEEKQQALYDMGNCAFKQENLSEAVQHFEAAVGLNPNDTDAQHNLDLARQALAAQHQEQQDESPSQKGQPSPPDQKGTAGQASEKPELGDSGGQAGDKPQTAESGQTGDKPQAADSGQTGDKPQAADSGQAGDKPQAADSGQTGDKPQATDTTQAINNGKAGAAKAPDPTQPAAAAGASQQDPAQDRTAHPKGATDDAVTGAAPHDPHPTADSNPNSQHSASHGGTATTAANAAGRGKMTRAQAERLLEMVGESRPPHPPPADQTSGRDASGKDY